MKRIVEGADAMMAARYAIAERFSQLGITGHKAMTEYIARNTKPESHEKPSLQDMQDLIRKMDEHLAFLDFWMNMGVCS
ncbi:MAG TPA: hypothetical protein VEZ13_13450 [Brevibacillus sp.]|nr:hypothetical protein [Brevibacillus sp.]